MFYGNKWHYVGNHNALTKDFLNLFAYDLIRGSGKNTMYEKLLWSQWGDDRYSEKKNGFNDTLFIV